MYYATSKLILKKITRPSIYNQFVANVLSEYLLTPENRLLNQYIGPQKKSRKNLNLEIIVLRKGMGNITLIDSNKFLEAMNVWNLLVLVFPGGKHLKLCVEVRKFTLKDFY